MNKALSRWMPFLFALVVSIAFSATPSLGATPPPLSRPTEDLDSGTSSETYSQEMNFLHHTMDAAVDIQFVPISYKNYLWSGSQQVNRTGSGIHLAVEWLPISRYGKLGIGGGIGYNLFRNVSLPNGGRASLNTFPLEAFLSYRFDYLRNQILVPFAKVGPEMTFLGQTNSGYAGHQMYYGLDYAAGVELCMNNLERRASREMANSIGIYGTYLIFEYVKSTDLSTRKGPDLRRDEYRFGLRFEM